MARNQEPNAVGMITGYYKLQETLCSVSMLETGENVDTIR